MKLFTFFRSSAAFRVRIAINLKGMDVEHASIHLRRGEQLAPAYASLNPQRLVPALLDGPNILTQSLAIIGPTLADVCLIPQVYNAERAGNDMTAYPIIRRINRTCTELPAFAKASPDRQPDADA